jgi:desulfoferrodoxin-like iron-binding protein
MDSTNVKRREFLQTAGAAGVVALSAASLFNVQSAETALKPKKMIYVCQICGHVEFGTAPENCPICHAPKDKFEMNDALFTDAETKFKTATDKHVPVIIAKKKSPIVTEEASISAMAKIGTIIHPTTAEHHIRFIDCYIDDVYAGRSMQTLHLHPTANFDIKTPGSTVRIVALCTLHGYWQSEAVPS